MHALILIDARITIFCLPYDIGLKLFQNPLIRVLCCRFTPIPLAILSFLPAPQHLFLGYLLRSRLRFQERPPQSQSGFVLLSARVSRRSFDGNRDRYHVWLWRRRFASLLQPNQRGLHRPSPHVVGACVLCSAELPMTTSKRIHRSFRRT